MINNRRCRSPMNHKDRAQRAQGRTKRGLERLRKAAGADDQESIR